MRSLFRPGTVFGLPDQQAVIRIQHEALDPASDLQCDQGLAPVDDDQTQGIREVTVRIREDAWPSIADSIGLPLGVLG